VADRKGGISKATVVRTDTESGISNNLDTNEINLFIRFVFTFTTSAMRSFKILNDLKRFTWACTIKCKCS